MENKYSEYQESGSIVGVFGRLALSAKNEREFEEDEAVVKFQAKRVKDEAQRLERVSVQKQKSENLARQLSIEENEAFEASEKERRRSLIQEEKHGEDEARRVDLEMKDADLARKLTSLEQMQYDQMVGRNMQIEDKDGDIARSFQKRYEQEHQAMMAERKNAYDRDREVASKLQGDISREESAKASLVEDKDFDLANKMQVEQKKLLKRRADEIAKAWRNVKVKTQDVDQGLSMSFALPELDRDTVRVARIEKHSSALQVRAESTMLSAVKLLELPEENHHFVIDLKLDCDSDICVNIEDVSWEYSVEEQTLFVVVKNLVLRQCSGDKKSLMTNGIKDRFLSRLSSLRTRIPSSRSLTADSKGEFSDIN